MMSTLGCANAFEKNRIENPKRKVKRRYLKKPLLKPFQIYQNLREDINKKITFQELKFQPGDWLVLFPGSLQWALLAWCAHNPYSLNATC